MTICFALLIPCLLAFEEPAAPANKQPEVTVEFLRDVLRSQLESVPSLSATYSISQKALASPAQDWGPTDYELHNDETRISIRVNQNTSAVLPYRYTFDGRTGYHVAELASGTTQVEIVAERPRNADVIDRPLDPIGARVRLADLSLPALMEDPNCLLNGLVDLDGVPCWSVTVNGIDKRAESPIIVQVWFDPAYDYLPHRISVLREGFSPKEFCMTWEVVRFEKTTMNDGLRWFPVLAEFRQVNSVQTLSVAKFDLSPELHDGTFVPDVRSAAQVVDIRNPAQVRTYVTGGSESIDRRAKQLARSATESARSDLADPTQLSAAPEQSQLWLQVMLWSSVACLVAGIVMWRRYG